MKILFTCLFIIVSLIHLYASMKKNKKLRNITKVFILPFLTLIYIFGATNSVRVCFVVALLFSWLGDIFLIFKGHLLFALGGIAFGLSHIFFLVSYYPYINLDSYGIIILIIAVLFYSLYVYLYFKDLKPYIPNPLFIPMVAYLFSNVANNVFALAMLVSKPSLVTFIVYAGTLLFFISDSILFHVRFKVEDSNQNHFVVMATYILAEFLIVFGMSII